MVDKTTKLKKIERQTERRKHKRYKVQEGVFAVLGPHTPKMGKIIDISSGGIAFYHKDSKASIEKDHELSILFDNNQTDGNYGPLKFQATIISELPLDSGRMPNATCRCGLQFQNLTYYQRSWLMECIKKYTLTENGAPPG